MSWSISLHCLPTCGADHLRQRNRQLEPPRERQTAAGHQFAEAPALDPLHREEVNAVVLFDGVDGDDVRMVQPGDRFGLAPEALDPISVKSELLGQDLQRDLALALRVLG